MTRIFGDYAYSNGPRAGCWWDATCDIPPSAPLTGEARCDVAVIGGGFTGLSAALHLAEVGRDVAVLEGEQIGWGASGRNGGFCCLGGGKLGDSALDKRFGRAERIAFRRAERAATELVATLMDRHKIKADRHSDGETQLAHRPKDMEALEAEASSIEENYGVMPTLLSANDLRQHGMGGPFHGALHIPLGFGLNPRKYLAGLRNAALRAGVRIYERSAVTRMDAGWTLRTAQGVLRARHVVIATNGYSSEALPRWLSARYMPAQSTVLVTRPLTKAEQQEAGWTSDRMAYDSRHLLHYFRLMPDGRFLFGMRGALRSSPGAETKARARTRRDFDVMFPAWRHVEAHHSWSGFVALARGRMPFVGSVPGTEGLWASLCYHGNGVAMGTYCGKLLAGLITGTDTRPKAMAQPLSRFPLGRARRLIMPPVYAAYHLADRA